MAVPTSRTSWIRSGSPLSKASTAAAKTSPGSGCSSSCLGGDLPAGVAGDTQAVEVGFDAVVESSQFPEHVVRAVDGIVAEQPEEGGFFGMLFDHGGNDSHSEISGVGDREGSPEEAQSIRVQACPSKAMTSLRTDRPRTSAATSVMAQRRRQVLAELDSRQVVSGERVRPPQWTRRTTGPRTRPAPRSLRWCPRGRRRPPLVPPPEQQPCAAGVDQAVAGTADVGQDQVGGAVDLLPASSPVQPDLSLPADSVDLAFGVPIDPLEADDGPFPRPGSSPGRWASIDCAVPPVHLAASPRRVGRPPDRADAPDEPGRRRDAAAGADPLLVPFSTVVDEASPARRPPPCARPAAFRRRPATIQPTTPASRHRPPFQVRTAPSAASPWPFILDEDRFPRSSRATAPGERIGVGPVFGMMGASGPGQSVKAGVSGQPALKRTGGPSPVDTALARRRRRATS